MACGSGAFLVQVCIYLSLRLLEAWEEVERRVEGTPRITPYGESRKGLPEEQLIPLDRRGAAALRPAAGGRAVSLRRGQEPAGGRDGEAVALAADVGEGQAVRHSSTTPSGAAIRSWRYISTS